MTIFPVLTDKKRYLPLLLLGDEQEDMIDRYLSRGTLYVLEQDGAPAAVCVVTDEGEGVLEIKNLAVAPALQRRGYGRKMIEFLLRRYSGVYHTLQLGTGDSPLTVPFYRSCGFTPFRIVPDFSRSTTIIPLLRAASPCGIWCISAAASRSIFLEFIPVFCEIARFSLLSWQNSAVFRLLFPFCFSLPRGRIKEKPERSHSFYETGHRH